MSCWPFHAVAVAVIAVGVTAGGNEMVLGIVGVASGAVRDHVARRIVG